MRDKHLHIAEHSALLKKIYQTAEAGLAVNKTAFIRLLLIKFLVYGVLMLLAYYALYHQAYFFPFILCFVAYGMATLLFAFNFSHDFSHNTVFGSKKANHWCFVIIYTLVGAHAEAWKYRHINSHHYAPNVEGYDSDLSISSLIRVVPGSRYHWYHRFQHIYAPLAYTTYSLFWVFIKDFVILFSDKKRSRRFGWQLSFWLQKAIYITLLLVLPALYSGMPFYIVLTGFVAMHLTQSVFLLFTFFMTHHVEETEYPTVNEQGFINTSWLMNQVKSSNDMHPFSEAANFIFGGFNNHIAHHLFPHIHHIYYPKLNRILYGMLKEHQIQPNQTTYWGGIAAHLRLLKKMGMPPAKTVYKYPPAAYHN
jgi:linoleoyl-CoA desaturase